MTTPGDTADSARTRIAALARLDRQDVYCRPPPEFAQSAAIGFAEELELIDPNSNVFVDMAGMTFCDSSGLNVLVIAQNRLRSGGGALILQNQPAMFARMVEATGLTRYLGSGKR